MYIITKDGSWGNACHLLLFEDINDIIKFLNEAYKLTIEENIKSRNITVIFDNDETIKVETRDIKANSHHEEVKTYIWKLFSIPTYSDTQLSTIDEENSLTYILNNFKSFYL